MKKTWRGVALLLGVGLVLASLPGIERSAIGAPPGEQPAATQESPANAPQESAPQESAAKAPTDPLLEQVEQAIDVTSRRYLDGNVHTPWQIIHAFLGMRDRFILKVDGKKVNGLEWISNGPVYKGQPWFEKTQYGGRAQPFNGVPYAFEGHPNQFMGYMSMCNLPLDHKFKTTGDESITVADILRNAQMEVRAYDDNTWTLWLLAHYLGPDARWVNRYGEEWSVERLVQHEIASVVTRAPCGGTHGLFALSYARNGYIQSGRPLAGVWLEAEQKIRRYTEEARLYQNPDGFFSSNHFRGPGYSHDFSTRISAAGHILEFLMVALPQKRLEEEWVRRGVAAVAKDLVDHRKESAECGGLYHSLDALVIYRDRVKPPAEPAKKPAMVDSEKKEQDGAAQPGEKPAEEPQNSAASTKGAEEQSAAKPVIEPARKTTVPPSGATAVPLTLPAPSSN